MISEVQQTILEQIGAKQLSFCGFKLITGKESNELIIHKGLKTIAIKYNYEVDLYDLRLIKMNRKTLEVTEEFLSQMYADQLRETISEFFKFEYLGLRGVKL
jgi:hypothetical protein